MCNAARRAAVASLIQHSFERRRRHGDLALGHAAREVGGPAGLDGQPLRVRHAHGVSGRRQWVFIRIPSTPCSIVTQASEAVPTPASTTTGTVSRCLIVRTPYGFRSPSPLPIGDASGITAAHPASSRRNAVTRSSLV